MIAAPEQAQGWIVIVRNAVAIRKLREWAGRRHVVEASFAVGESVRLADLCRNAGLTERLDARWSFESGIEGFPIVAVRARGALQLECQRCLTPLIWPIEVDCRLTVVRSEKEIREVALPYDTVVAGQDGLVLGTILEDEILTSLPMAPAHEQCPVKGQAEAHSSLDASRPLAGLGALLRQGRSEGAS